MNTSHLTSRSRFATELALLGALSTFSLAAAPIEYTPIIIKTSDTAVSGLVDAYNQPNNSSGYYESQFEYGVEAHLDPTAPLVLRNIELPYYSNYDQLGALTVRVYANDGPILGSGIYASATPQTLLSEVVTDVAGPGATTLNIAYAFNALNVLPSTVTVTLDFDGIGGANTAGWYLSTAANTVGTQGDYIWQRTAKGDWSRINAVPEPGMTAALAGLSLLGFGMVRASLRRSRK